MLERARFQGFDVMAPWECSMGCVSVGSAQAHVWGGALLRRKTWRGPAASRAPGRPGTPRCTSIAWACRPGRPRRAGECSILCSACAAHAASLVRAARVQLRLQHAPFNSAQVLVLSCVYSSWGAGCGCVTVQETVKF